MANFLYHFVKVVFSLGSIAIVLLILGMLFYFAGYMWVEASKKWRDVCKGESMIYEYMVNRREYLEWKKEKEGEQ